jgi:cobalt-zinc-cadmium efflux system protein
MHAHPHGHHHDEGQFMLALALTFSFALVEVGGGWWANSLALLSDAGHMVSDATALGLAALAAWVARRPPSERHSYGLVRAEVVAAVVNAMLMLGVVAAIAVSAVERLQTPRSVTGGAVTGIAALGLLVNLSVIGILSRAERTLNSRAAMLHVLGDLLGSLAALTAGAVITLTGWTPIDPLSSLFICALILYSSVRLLLEALHVLMEGVPPHLDLGEIGRDLAQVDGVRSVHDLHVWALASGRVALSAHVVLRDMATWPAVLSSLRQGLHESYGIDHVTLQPELDSQTLHPMKPPNGHPALGGQLTDSPAPQKPRGEGARELSRSLQPNESLEQPAAPKSPLTSARGDGRARLALSLCPP